MTEVAAVPKDSRLVRWRPDAPRGTALGDEARNTRRSIPASTMGVVIAAGIFYLLVVCAETFGVGRQGIPGFVRQPSPLGYLTSRYWSPSALWTLDLVVMLTGLGFAIAVVNAALRILFAMGREQALPASFARLSRRQTPAVSIGCVAVLALAFGLPLTYADGGVRTFGYLAGAGGLSVVLVYLAVNIAAIRAFRTEFRDQFRLWRHLLVPATAAVLFLFPLWGILHPPARALADLLPFTALGWLCIGAIAAGIRRRWRPASFETLGIVFVPATDGQGDRRALRGSRSTSRPRGGV
jgi:amino acid transporter